MCGAVPRMPTVCKGGMQGGAFQDAQRWGVDALPGRWVMKHPWCADQASISLVTSFQCHDHLQRCHHGPCCTHRETKAQEGNKVTARASWLESGPVETFLIPKPMMVAKAA